MPVLWAERPQADRLAMAYQRGETWALEPLYESVRPIIAYELGVARSRARSLGLPLALEHADLQQESWIALAHLATIWQPELGEFGAYVRASFGWALTRYIRVNSHARRSRVVAVQSLPHAVAADLAAQQVGEDGRDFAERIAWAELVDALPRAQRDAVRLCIIEGLTVREAGGRLGRAATTVNAALERARVSLRHVLATGRMPRRPAAAAPRVAMEPPAVALLRALLAEAYDDGWLPGRAIACRVAGISLRQYGPAMRELVAAGLVAGRYARRAGRLDCAAAGRWLESAR